MVELSFYEGGGATVCRVGAKDNDVVRDQGWYPHVGMDMWLVCLVLRLIMWQLLEHMCWCWWVEWIWIKR